MKKTRFNFLLLTGLAALTALYSCQKSGMNNSVERTTNEVSALVSANQAILVSSSATSTTNAAIAGDAVYIIHAYAPGFKKDSIGFTALPAGVGTYLTANYAGYTFQKAYKITNTTGTLDSYVVVIQFNGKPVGLKFDATGNFVLVFEQSELQDMGGLCWHNGGRFGDRDGRHRDTVAVTALPADIKAYFKANYSTDTLLHAAINLDGTYLIISANKGLFATAITVTGTLIKRVQIYPHPNNRVAVAQSAILPAITTYLTTTFPGYVFDKAYAERANTTVLAYDVLINVNGTRHAVEFDAAGKFVKNFVIR